MAKKEYHIEKYPDIPADSAFVRIFQQQIMRLLKKRGKLSETQYRRGMQLLGEELP